MLIKHMALMSTKWISLLLVKRVQETPGAPFIKTTSIKHRLQQNNSAVRSTSLRKANKTSPQS